MPKAEPAPWMLKAAMRIFVEREKLNADEMAGIIEEEYVRDGTAQCDPAVMYRALADAEDVLKQVVQELERVAAGRIMRAKKREP